MRLGRQLRVQSFHTICMATNVLPLPVAMVSSNRSSPRRMARTARLDGIALGRALLLYRPVRVAQRAVESVQQALGGEVVVEAAPFVEARPQHVG